jgi:hypothetical protein
VFLKREFLLISFFTRDGGQVQRVNYSKCDIGPTYITCYQYGVLRFTYIFEIRLFSCNNSIMTTRNVWKAQSRLHIVPIFFIAQAFMNFLISPSSSRLLNLRILIIMKAHNARRCLSCNFVTHCDRALKYEITRNTNTFHCLKRIYYLKIIIFH